MLHSSPTRDQSRSHGGPALRIALHPALPASEARLAITAVCGSAEYFDPAGHGKGIALGLMAAARIGYGMPRRRTRSAKRGSERNGSHLSLIISISILCGQRRFGEIRKETGRSAAENRPGRDWTGEMLPACSSISRPIPARPVFRARCLRLRRRQDTPRLNRRPVRHPDICCPFGIIAESLGPQGAAASVRKDPVPSSAGF
jgi:hypothetical protein